MQSTSTIGIAIANKIDDSIVNSIHEVYLPMQTGIFLRSCQRGKVVNNIRSMLGPEGY